jgi:hypothetical protein
MAGEEIDREEIRRRAHEISLRDDAGVSRPQAT